MQQQESKIDMRRFWRAAKQWKWVMLAIIVVFTGIGIWISVGSLPKYEIQGQMLIGEIGYDTENRSGGISQMMKTFSVGGFSASTVDNEVIILDSHDVMLRTARTLGLNRTYIGKDRNGEKAMLYKNTPVLVEAPTEYFDTLNASYKIKIVLADDGKADIVASKGLLNSKIAELNGVDLPCMLETCYGTVRIMPTDLFKSSPYRVVNVAVTGNEIAASSLHKMAEIDVADKLSDIINVDLEYANSDLGKTIVNGIMTEYNAKRLDRLHEASLASIKYYDDRIAETFKVLQQEEKKVSDYQRKNELMGIDSELGILVGEAVNSKSAIQTANYNIAYYETVLNILRNKLDDDVIIPQMESLSDPNIGAFNGAIQARRELRRSATEDNEALRLLNERIEELRNLIIENSTKMISKAKADVQHQQNLASKAQGRLDEYPDYQLEFMNLVRDKDYQNQLYQYLVSQRENSVLQLYSSTNIGFVFQEAYVAKTGGILKKLIWPVALFILALFGVTCLAIFIMLISRKVNDPMDLAFLGTDANAVKGSGADDLRLLRTKLMADKDLRVLYVTNLGGISPITSELANTFLSIGRSVETITGLSGNDELLSTDIQNQIAGALDTTDFVIAEVPEPTKLATLENIIDKTESALVIALPEKQITRKKLKSILKGQTASHIFTYIAK